MEFGYPGANTHLENHGVSEESFWPSFTDIMMVIVMVFLLVTVAVILNNWSLIGDLKNSIQAQKVASSLAENRQVENANLGSQLSQLEKQIVLLNEKYELEKANLLTSKKLLEEKQQALSVSQQALTENQEKLVLAEKQVNEKGTALVALQTQLKSLNESLETQKASLNEAQQKLSEKETALAKLQTDLTDVIKQKDELIELNKSHNNAIAENEKVQQTLREELDASKSTILALEKQQKSAEKEVQALKQSDEIKTQVLASLQTDRSNLEKAVMLLKSDQTKSQALETKLQQLQQAQQKQQESLLSVTSTEKKAKDALNEAQLSLKKLEEEKQRIITAMNEKLVESEKKVATLEATLSDTNAQIKAKDKELLSLKDNSKLLSLQGKYDTLDAKYQKLLRPARSSKGKYIVSVTYKKKGGKRIIRLKSSPTGNYKTVSKKELHRVLAKLKAKHKNDLYMKVIIPETSGLSYSEAWKFTSNLQKKYDYYHQPDNSK